MTTNTYKVEGFPSQKYWVFEVDSKGNEIAEAESGQKGYVLDTIEKEFTDSSVTDIIIAAHGWNTNQDKEDGENKNEKLNIFEKWFKGICEDIKARPYPSSEKRKFVMLGVHWPSSIGVGQADEVIDDDETFEVNAKRMRKLAEKLKDTNLPAWREITNLVDDVVAVTDKREGNISTLALSDKVDKVRQMLENPDLDDISDNISIIDSSAEQGAESIRPDMPGGLYRFGQIVIGSVFRPLEKLLFGQYLARAEAVGRNGVHTLLAFLQERAPVRARFHMLGHSLGGPLVFGALSGPENGSYLLRKKVHSVTVLQGAMSNQSISKGKRFHAMTTGMRPAAGPILFSLSNFDTALRSFQFFYSKPVGLHGAVDVDPLPLRERELRTVPTDYGLAKAEVFNVKCDKFISDTKGPIDPVGAHSDIYDPELMHLVRQAIDTPVPIGEYRLATDLSQEFFRKRLPDVDVSEQNAPIDKPSPEKTESSCTIV